mmetsp:Transcript_6566/g.13719  ORF Transcript_6566/g.13719 Transcript_6566/m.13719 type:complete len:572 (-) Transcript_6566:487-2202(-)
MQAESATPSTRKLRKGLSRKRSSAVAEASLQVERPFFLAFVALLIVYTGVNLLTYEKLTRSDGHVGGKDGQVEIVNGDSEENAGLQTNTRKMAVGGGNNAKTVDYLQHHSFPVHVTKEDSELISHPGLDLVEHPELIPEHVPRKIMVPKFWSEAYAAYYNETESVRNYLGHGHRLMTPQEAASVGSYSSEGFETIYASVASYRDYECTPTVRDMYERAQHPERLRVAVIDQAVGGTEVSCLTPDKPCTQDPEQTLCKYRHLMDHYHLEAELAVGPVFARHLAHRMYRGEYYAMQVDSHVRFTQDWDSYLVNHWKNAKNEYAVLTTYLSDINGRIDPRTHKGTDPGRPIMCNSDFEGGGDNKHLRHGQQPEGTSQIHGHPTLEPFWAAGFSFARGHFVVNVPYDQYLPMIFQGEEISIGLRAFTYGYDMYAPEIGVVFHIYANQDKTGKRHAVPMFWENSKLYRGAGLSAMKRLNTIIGLSKVEYPLSEYPHLEMDKYGLGTVRKTEKFYETFGIHVHEQWVEHHLCRFVGKPMMKEFLPALRSDRMGLDYDKISFVFQDPDPPRNARRGPR